MGTTLTLVPWGLHRGAVCRMRLTLAKATVHILLASLYFYSNKENIMKATLQPKNFNFSFLITTDLSCPRLVIPIRAWTTRTPDNGVTPLVGHGQEQTRF